MWAAQPVSSFSEGGSDSAFGAGTGGAAVGSFATVGGIRRSGMFQTVH